MVSFSIVWWISAVWVSLTVLLFLAADMSSARRWWVLHATPARR